MVLIGLMGCKGSGKTLGAEYLKQQYGFVEKSFAECLKRAFQQLFLLSDEQVFGTQEQKETPDPRWFGCTPRKMLQFVGTDLLRENLDKIMPGLGNNVFTHHFKLWYEELISRDPAACVVVSDVRFQNEIDFIQSLGGVVIKIERPGTATDDMHPSEKEMLSITTYNYRIDNKYTKEAYYMALSVIIQDAFGSHDTPVNSP